MNETRNKIRFKVRVKRLFEPLLQVALFAIVTASMVEFLFGDARLMAAFTVIGAILAFEMIGCLAYDWDVFNITHLTTEDVEVILLGVLATLGGGALVASVFLHPSLDPAMHGTFRRFPTLTIQVFVVVAVVFPLFEEFAFRHALQERGLGWAPVWIRVTVPAILFWLGHVMAYPGGFNPDVLATLAVNFPTAITLAICYEKTSNISVPILIHGLTNAITLVAFYKFILPAGIL